MFGLISEFGVKLQFMEINASIGLISMLTT